MAGSDARDLMGLPSVAPPKPNPKPPKPKVKGPSGMAREILDLNFEGAPSISIVAPKFKEKPKFPFKPRRWEWTSFSNSARKDDLILRHWRREGEAPPTTTGLPVTPADSNAAEEMDIDERSNVPLQDAVGAKWNAKIPRPTYTNEQYNEHLMSDEWSKEETDYLVDLAVEFDLRWVVIADRYDFKRQDEPRDPNAMDLDIAATAPKSREMEDLKARYYTVAAKCITFQTPLSSMNKDEFAAHEMMTKFNASQEKARKKHVNKLMSRTQEEAAQEDRLLKELHRIVVEQEKLFEDRKALYDRLETPRAINPVAAHASTSIYQSSQGLQQLMQSMLQAQRMKINEQREKRRAGLGSLDTEAAQQAMMEGRGHRASLGSASAISDKRQSHSAVQQRQISHSDRAKFGVAYPQERLTSGVQFRHERVTRASLAKSAIQTSRINDALAELGIPARLVMPTTNVVAAYEKVVDGVKMVVEVKKMREKMEGEIRNLTAQKNMANGQNHVNRDSTHWQGTMESKAKSLAEVTPKGEAVDDSEDETDDTKPATIIGQEAPAAASTSTRNGPPGHSSDQEIGEDNEVAEGEVENEEERGDGVEHEESDEAEADRDDEDQDEDEDEDEEEQDEEEGPEAKVKGFSRENLSLRRNGTTDQAHSSDEEEDDSSEEDIRPPAVASDEEEDEEDEEEVDDEKEADAEEAEEHQESEDEDEEEEEDDGDDSDANAAEALADEPESPEANSVRKRSASVISALSNKSSKRQRK